MPIGESRGGMQRVLIVSDRTPFIDAQHDAVHDGLLSALCSAGVEAEAIRLPYHNDVVASMPDMLARRSLDVWNADRLIALSFPACLLVHAEKVVWLIEDVGQLPSAVPGMRLALREARRVYSASRSASSRIFQETRHKSKVLALPSRSSDWRHIVSELLS